MLLMLCFAILVHCSEETLLGQAMVSETSSLTEKITKHEKSTKHMSNTVDLTLLGNANIANEENSGYRLSIVKHNKHSHKKEMLCLKLLIA